MSKPSLTPKLDTTIDDLTQRNELFQLIQDSHLQWMDETNDLKIKEMHRALANLFQTAMEQYEVLLDTLRSQR
jgi:hypothetical protein